MTRYGWPRRRLADVEPTDDPRALDRQQHPRLGEEATTHVVVPAPVVGEDLDGHLAVEHVVEGQPHGGERTGTQDTLQSVGSNHLGVGHAAESRRRGWSGSTRRRQWKRRET